MDNYTQLSDTVRTLMRERDQLEFERDELIDASRNLLNMLTYAQCDHAHHTRETLARLVKDARSNR